MMKQCTKCKQWKEEEEFSWKNKDLNKRHSQCKECRRKADNKRYAENPNRRAAVKAVHDNQVKYIRKYVQDIKKHSKCAICGENRWYVLDFHHLYDKSFTIANKISKGCSLETIKSEIEKCIVLCANCHRELHYKENLKKQQESRNN